MTSLPNSSPRVLEVLIVDDHVDTADSLGMLLEMSGHQVSSVHDGPAALVAVQSRQPDVVVLDVGLPGMDGLEVARRLRQSFSRPLRIVGLSGHGRGQDFEAAQQAGIDVYLVKPVDPVRIVSVVEGSDGA